MYILYNYELHNEYYTITYKLHNCIVTGITRVIRTYTILDRS